MSKKIRHLKLKCPRSCHKLLSKLKNEFMSAYLQLLQHHSPKDITVKKVVQLASASRSTFYTYFGSKEQLQEQVKRVVQQQFMAFYSEGEQSLDGHKTTLVLCQHILKYRAFYHYVFQDANEIQFMSEELSTRLIEVYNDKDYAIFASYGTIGYLKKWVEEGFVISPTEAAEKLLKIGFTDWTYGIRKRVPNLIQN